MLVLASGSPRRRQLLEERGIAFEVVESGIDEHMLRPGEASPSEWVMALAYIKARAVAEALNERSPSEGAIGGRDCIVLGADTMCLDEGEMLGKPETEAEAAAMLRRFVNGEHAVITGVALVCAGTFDRMVFADPARVRWGEVSEDEIAAYVSSGEWRGKAGGYNLAERQAAGWQIEVKGDPASVMGLPVDRVMAAVRGFEERREGVRDADQS